MLLTELGPQQKGRTQALRTGKVRRVDAINGRGGRMLMPVVRFLFPWDSYCTVEWETVSGLEGGAPTRFESSIIIEDR